MNHPYLKNLKGELVFVLPAGDVDAIIAVSAYAGNLETAAATDARYHEVAKQAREAITQMADWQKENPELLRKAYEGSGSPEKDPA